MTDELTFLQSECRDLLGRLTHVDSTPQDINTISTAFYQGVASALNQLSREAVQGAKPGEVCLRMGKEVQAYVETRYHLNQFTVSHMPRLIPDPSLTSAQRK